jgi:hypothetical protein
VAAWASSWVVFELTSSRRQFWHYSAAVSHAMSADGKGGTYDGHGLRGLDRQAVRLNGRAGTGFVGLLVLALDLYAG